MFRLDLRRIGLTVLALFSVSIAGWYTVCWLVETYHYRAAAIPLRNRDFRTADRHLAWCRWAWPRNGNAWLLSARTARRAGNKEQAQAWLERAEQAGARPREVRLERLLQEGQWAFSPEVEDALQHQLTVTRTNYPLVAEVLTAEYMRLYRLPDARQVLNRWIELDPTDVEAWLRRGWVAEHQLDFDLALADYRQALELEPGRHPVRLRVAEILFKVRKPAEALSDLENLYAQIPTDLAVTLNLSRCRRELGHYDEAKSVLDALPSASQKEARILAERGQISLALERVAEAESLFRTALRDMPREREVLYGLQQALSRQGKDADAKEVQATLTQVDADGRRMGEIITALTRDPANAELRFEGALNFLRNGIVEDGVRWLEMAVDADPRHAAAHERLAEQYDKMGRAELASKHRQAARRIESSPR